MMAAPSLTRRLIWTLTAGAAVLWLAAALFVAATIRSRLDAALDGSLQETAERLLPLAVDGFRDYFDDSDNERTDHEIPLFDEGGNEYIFYQVRAADGQVLLRSHDAPTSPFPVALSAGFADAGPWRIFTLSTSSGEVYIQVAEATRHRADTLGASLLALLLPIGVLIPLSALGISIAVRRGLRPVRTFSEEIGSRHAANLAPLEATSLPAELRPISNAVDGLIGRLRAALDAERAFAANSAHELRTPIAGSLAQTQRLIAELGDAPAAGRARQVEESLRRLRLLADKLLQLSRAEAGMAMTITPIDLLPALRVLVADAQRRPGGEHIALAVSQGVELIAAIDVDAFGIVIRNLLDNALAHGKSGDAIAVAVLPGNVVEIVNGGEPVAAESLAQLTQRFVRGDTTATGSGLGLAIVDSLMRQIGGRLDLLSPAPGREDGFCARLTLPAA